VHDERRSHEGTEGRVHLRPSFSSFPISGLKKKHYFGIFSSPLFYKRDEKTGRTVFLPSAPLLRRKISSVERNPSIVVSESSRMVLAGLRREFASISPVRIENRGCSLRSPRVFSARTPQNWVCNCVAAGRARHEHGISLRGSGFSGARTTHF
jgi:hypothetical protein